MFLVVLSKIVSIISVTFILDACKVSFENYFKYFLILKKVSLM